MKFIDFLKERDKDEILYIGTVEGSGWIVIESVSTIINNLSKIEGILRGRVEKTIKSCQNKLDTLPTTIVGLQEKIKTEEDHERKVKLIIKLENNERSYANAWTTRGKCEKKLGSWKIIDKRMILNTYQHETDVVGLCVILEGSDDGTLWFKDEKKVL